MHFFLSGDCQLRLLYSALERCQKAVHLTWTPAAPCHIMYHRWWPHSHYSLQPHSLIPLWQCSNDMVVWWFDGITNSSPQHKDDKMEGLWLHTHGLILVLLFKQCEQHGCMDDGNISLTITLLTTSMDFIHRNIHFHRQPVWGLLSQTITFSGNVHLATSSGEVFFRFFTCANNIKLNVLKNTCKIIVDMAVTLSWQKLLAFYI